MKLQDARTIPPPTPDLENHSDNFPVQAPEIPRSLFCVENSQLLQLALKLAKFDQYSGDPDPPLRIQMVRQAFLEFSSTASSKKRLNCRMNMFRVKSAFDQMAEWLRHKIPTSYRGLQSFAPELARINDSDVIFKVRILDEVLHRQLSIHHGQRIGARFGRLAHAGGRDDEGNIVSTRVNRAQIRTDISDEAWISRHK